MFLFEKVTQVYTWGTLGPFNVVKVPLVYTRGTLFSIVGNRFLLFCIKEGFVSSRHRRERHSLFYTEEDRGGFDLPSIEERHSLLCVPPLYRDERLSPLQRE